MSYEPRLGLDFSSGWSHLSGTPSEVPFRRSSIDQIAEVVARESFGSLSFDDDSDDRSDDETFGSLSSPESDAYHEVMGLCDHYGISPDDFEREPRLLNRLSSSSRAVFGALHRDGRLMFGSRDGSPSDCFEDECFGSDSEGFEFVDEYGRARRGVRRRPVRKAVRKAVRKVAKKAAKRTARRIAGRQSSSSSSSSSGSPVSYSVPPPEEDSYEEEAPVDSEEVPPESVEEEFGNLPAPSSHRDSFTSSAVSGAGFAVGFFGALVGISLIGRAFR